MNHPLTKGLAAVVTLLVLSSCGFPLGPGGPGLPPTVDREVNSSSGAGAAQASLTLAPNETKVIRVSVPSAQRAAARRLVLEAGDDAGASQLDMVLYAGDGVTPIASTSGTAFFRPGLLGIDQGFVGTALGAEPLQVVAGVCRGPCISTRSNVSSVYVELTNVTGATVVVPFYAFTEAWITPNEPVNDFAGGAVAVSEGSPFTGAIERIGDVDHLVFTQSGFIAFDERANYDVNLELDHFTATGAYIRTVYPGDPAFEVFANEYAVVRSTPGERRASVYGLYFVYYD